uniref:Uncharacterized protein n=1 Tax=Triticum urartu TaxID=4572 RepID=A0A8R7P8D0_TRIUA
MSIFQAQGTSECLSKFELQANARTAADVYLNFSKPDKSSL